MNNIETFLHSSMDSIEYETISNYLHSKSYSVPSTKEQNRMIRKKAARYELVAGKLVRSLVGCQLLVIRRSELEDISKEVHDKRPLSKDRYYWPSMYRDIKTYVTHVLAVKRTNRA